MKTLVGFLSTAGLSKIKKKKKVVIKRVLFLVFLTVSSNSFENCKLLIDSELLWPPNFNFPKLSVKKNLKYWF